MTSPDIDALYESGSISATDWAFAHAVQRLGPCHDPWMALAAALVSRAAAAGHVCLDLQILHDRGVKGENGEDFGIPRLDSGHWQRVLKDCAAVGAPGTYRPLILDGNRLYLHRLYTYERNLAREILRRCAAPMNNLDETRLGSLLLDLFPEGLTDQCKAAELVARQRFSVISGGPGTGKTYTVAKIILLLHRLASGRPSRILLAAPTGKAAARMQEAVAVLLKKEDSGQGGNQTGEPLEAQTLHRLLGYNPNEARFRYNADQPLVADAVIVDEASMIDLALMHQLVLAVPPEARLVLVGDKDQLASVEAGAVLGDICHGAPAGEHHHAPDLPPEEAQEKPLAGHIAILSRSYRFETQSGIDALSRAINAGDAEQVLSLLDGRLPAIRLSPLTDWAQMQTLLETQIDRYWKALFENSQPGAAFEGLSGFKILAAVRKGPFGVEALNARVERMLRRKGWIAPMFKEGWYPGRPVMITRNDYNHGLFNGDVGIASQRPDTPTGQVQVLFPGPRGSFKALAPHQLPEHETVYAMTIHKSQGSEFDTIMVVLPDADLPLLTRELIYTAVSRARTAIQVWADPALLALAVRRPIQRTSGLRDMLWA